MSVLNWLVVGCLYALGAADHLLLEVRGYKKYTLSLPIKSHQEVCSSVKYSLSHRGSIETAADVEAFCNKTDGWKRNADPGWRPGWAKGEEKEVVSLGKFSDVLTTPEFELASALEENHGYDQRIRQALALWWSAIRDFDAAISMEGGKKTVHLDLLFPRRSQELAAAWRALKDGESGWGKGVLVGNEDTFLDLTASYSHQQVIIWLPEVSYEEKPMVFTTENVPDYCQQGYAAYMYNTTVCYAWWERPDLTKICTKIYNTHYCHFRHRPEPDVRGEICNDRHVSDFSWLGFANK